MNHPVPRPAASAAALSPETVEEQLSSLAARDIGEHAQVYTELLSALHRDLDATAGGDA